MSVALFRVLVLVEAYRAGYVRVPLDVVVAQAWLETGGFRSAVYRDNRNAFGLKEPRKRPTLALGTARGHAVFATVADSVRDYFLRQRYFRIPDGAAPVFMDATVRSGYATASHYLQAWERVLASRPWASLS